MRSRSRSRTSEASRGRLPHWLLTILLAAGLPGASAAAADDQEFQLFDRFSVTVASYFAEVDTEIRLDSKELGDGVEVDFEDDLDLEASDSRLWLELAFRLGRRHEFGFSYFDWARGTETILLKEIQIGDEVFPIDATVQAFFDAKIAEIFYTYWLIHKQRVAFGISFGLDQIAIKAGVSEEELELEVEAETDLPVPMIGTEVRYAVSPKLILEAAGRFIDVRFGDYHGFAATVLIELEHRTFRHLGFGVGLNGLVLDVEVEEERFLGNFYQEYLGVQVFGRLRY